MTSCYLIELNGTQAAIRAGYSEKTAGQHAYQLLQKTSVQSYIDARKVEISEKTGITQEAGPEAFLISHAALIPIQNIAVEGDINTLARAWRAVQGGATACQAIRAQSSACAG